MHFPSTLLGIP